MEHDHDHDDHAHDHGRADDDELDPAEAEALADELAEATARMAAELGWAIGPHREREAYALAGAPVAVVFERGHGDDAKPQHRSGQLAPDLLPFLVDAVLRTRERLAYAADEDNPFLIALVLACFYAVESRRSGMLGLDMGALRALPQIELLRDDDATGDIRGVPGSAMLRAIAPVEAESGGEVVAAVQLVWRS